jgi:hypothetical protein
MSYFDFEPIPLREILPRISFDILLQAAIFASSAAAMACVTTPGYVYLGCWLGLVSQPFWFIATWRARQPGMFLFAMLMTGFWLRGIAAYS